MAFVSRVLNSSLVSLCLPIKWLEVDLLRLVASHVTVTEGIYHVVIDALYFFELQYDFAAALDDHPFGRQDSVGLLLADYNPPKFLLFLRVGQGNDVESFQLFVSCQLNLNSNLLFVDVNETGGEVHDGVTIAGCCYFLDVLAFEQSLPFVILHVHEIADSLDARLFLNEIG